jgi:nicotinamidase/pyrazinamidase
MTAPDIPRFETGDALLVVDVQRDLCPGGSMAVPLGDQVVVVLNAFI